MKALAQSLQISEKATSKNMKVLKFLHNFLWKKREDNVKISLNQERCEYKLWKINVLSGEELPILLSKLEVA